MRVHSVRNDDNEPTERLDISVIRAASHELRRKPKTNGNPRNFKRRSLAQRLILEEVQA